jgi:uncharacterized integral membrane protein
MKEIITDSIRYWEPRRIVFNAVLAVLAAVVVWSFVSHLPAIGGALSWPLILSLLLAAVIANLLYCTAYIADIFFQMSEYRQTWRRCRWALLAAGTAIAAALFVLHQ